MLINYHIVLVIFLFHSCMLGINIKATTTEHEKNRLRRKLPAYAIFGGSIDVRWMQPQGRVRRRFAMRTRQSEIYPAIS